MAMVAVTSISADRSATRREATRRESVHLSWGLIVFAVVLIAIPEEASIFLGGLRITAARLVLLCLFPYCLTRIVQDITAGRFRWSASDVLILPAGFWMVLSVWMTEGPERAIVGGGAIALEFVGGYIATRAFVTERGHALAMAGLLALLTATIGFLALLDSLTGHYLVHDTIGALTGYRPEYIYVIRDGILRAAGTFEHPILLGTGCLIALLFATTMHGWKRQFVFAGAGTGLVVALSSGPIGATLIGFTCLAYRKFTPGFEARWRWLAVLAAACLAALFAIHPAPFGWLIGHVTLDPATGFYRLLVWQVAGQDVIDSPIFGVGLTTEWARPDWMPTSVDSVWLRCAMMFGIPGAALIAACVLGACSRRIDTARVALSTDERNLGVCLSLVLFLYVLVGFTVSYWGITWVLMGVCAALRAQLGGMGSRPAAAGAPLGTVMRPAR
jgi:hypothetical protein